MFSAYLKLTPAKTFLDTCRLLPKTFLIPAATCRVVWCACKQCVVVDVTVLWSERTVLCPVVAVLVQTSDHVCYLSARPSATQWFCGHSIPCAAKRRLCPCSVSLCVCVCRMSITSHMFDTCRHLPKILLTPAGTCQKFCRHLPTPAMAGVSFRSGSVLPHDTELFCLWQLCAGCEAPLRARCLVLCTHC